MSYILSNQGWRRIAFTVPLLLLAVPSPAEETEPSSDTLDNIVVTASRLETRAGDAVRSVELITREEIDARQAAGVADVLRQAAGINVIQQGGRGGITSLLLRGGEPNFTVVMIDGIKVNDPTNTRGGSYDFSYLDVNDVKRIEIVRGPMSAVYGSDALAGVVNILTDQDHARPRIRAEFGSQDLQAGSFSFGHDFGHAELALTLHARNEGSDVEGSEYRDRGLQASVRVPWGDQTTVDLSGRYLDAASAHFPEDSGGPEFAILRVTDDIDVTESQAAVRLVRNLWSGWSGQLSFSTYDREEMSRSPGIVPGVIDGVPPSVTSTDFGRQQALVSLSGSPGETTRLVAGLEWQLEDGTSGGILDFGFPLPTDFELNRRSLSLFSEIEVDVGAVTLQGSGRVDDVDELGSNSSASLGAIIALPSDAGNIRITWGEGFKAPSFFALAHPLVGNPDLRPETATSIDVGYRKRFLPSGLELEASVFRNEYVDLIDFDPILFTSVNRSKVITKGVELSGRLQIADSVTLRVHGTYLDAEIVGSSTPMRGRPEWRGGFVAIWEANDRLTASASLLSLDDFYESSIPTGIVLLDGYTRLDVAARYRLTEKLTMGLAVDNALNSDFDEAVGFPAPGARVRVNASYVF